MRTPVVAVEALTMQPCGYVGVVGPPTQAIGWY